MLFWGDRESRASTITVLDRRLFHSNRSRSSGRIEISFRSTPL